jgi:hypothetical protein
MFCENKTPNETGWYWVQEDDSAGSWSMAFLDCDGDDPVLYLIDQAQVGRGRPKVWAMESVEEREYWQADDGTSEATIRQWHGPIECPGGDFGSQTVLFAAEDHERARASGGVLGLRCMDFRYCRDEKSSARITVVGVYSREEAAVLLKQVTDLEVPHDG